MQESSFCKKGKALCTKKEDNSTESLSYKKGRTSCTKKEDYFTRLFWKLYLFKSWPYTMYWIVMMWFLFSSLLVTFLLVFVAYIKRLSIIIASSNLEWIIVLFPTNYVSGVRSQLYPDASQRTWSTSTIISYFSLPSANLQRRPINQSLIIRSQPSGCQSAPWWSWYALNFSFCSLLLKLICLQIKFLSPPLSPRFSVFYLPTPPFLFILSIPFRVVLHQSRHYNFFLL